MTTSLILGAIVATTFGTPGPAMQSSNGESAKLVQPLTVSPVRVGQHAAMPANAGPMGLAGGSWAFSALTDDLLSSQTTRVVLPASALMFGLGFKGILNDGGVRSPHRRWMPRPPVQRRPLFKNVVHGAMAINSDGVVLTLRGRF